MMPTDSQREEKLDRRNFLKAIMLLAGPSFMTAFPATYAALAEHSKSTAKIATRRNMPKALLLSADLRTGLITVHTNAALAPTTGGSVMKLVAATCLLERNLINPNLAYDCKGHAQIDGKTFHCLSPHGRVDLTQAIAKSCNCYFVSASRKISSEAFIETLRDLRFDQPCAGVSSPMFPKSNHGPSYNYVLGLNPALKTTPLHLLQLASIIATNDKAAPLRRPGSHAKEPFSKEFSDSTWKLLRSGMILCAHQGTAAKLDPDNDFHIAAKTGTSFHGQKFQSCLIGFFPYDNPHYAICVSSPSGTSQESAVPDARIFLKSTHWQV